MKVVPIKQCPHCEKEYYEWQGVNYGTGRKVVWKRCDACGGSGSITTEQTIDGTAPTSWKLAYTCNKCGGSGVLDSGYFVME
jgi:DnaJ-class molecular chaperone